MKQIITSWKRVVAALLAASLIALAPLPAGTALAAAKRLTVTAQRANLFKTASSKGKVVLKLEKGDELTRLGSKGQYVKVKVDGKTGYIKKSAVKTASEEPYCIVKPASLKLRREPASSAKSLATLKKGKRASVLAVTEDGKWLKVQVGKKTGYLMKSKVKLNGKVEDTVANAQGEKPAEKQRVQAASVKVRASASASAKVKFTLKKGAKVTPLQASGQYVQISCAKGKGYLPASALEKQAEYKTLKRGSKGEEVKRLQKRLLELGYFEGTPAGNYQTLTAKAVKAFQKAAGLKATGVANAATQKAAYASDAPKNTAKKESAKKTVVESDWFTGDIEKVFARGTTATITDVKTGISWREQRRGGYNHADVQPVSAEDTAKFKKAIGGSWTWSRRAIWVSVGGKTYAASMNCMPHGDGAIKDNDFDGHHCIHFTNSRTHGSNRVDSAHQAAIKQALAAAK